MTKWCENCEQREDLCRCKPEDLTWTSATFDKITCAVLGPLDNGQFVHLRWNGEEFTAAELTEEPCPGCGLIIGREGEEFL